MSGPTIAILVSGYKKFDGFACFTIFSYESIEFWMKFKSGNQIPFFHYALVLSYLSSKKDLPYLQSRDGHKI
jgi:hypothetical protein